MTKEGTVRIRLSGLKGPQRLRILQKFDADFDINGEAEVPKFVADKLLGPLCVGSGFALVSEKEPEKTAPATKKKDIPVSKAQEQTEEKAFAKSIVE